MKDQKLAASSSAVYYLLLPDMAPLSRCNLSLSHHRLKQMTFRLLQILFHDLLLQLFLFQSKNPFSWSPVYSDFENNDHYLRHLCPFTFEKKRLISLFAPPAAQYLRSVKVSAFFNFQLRPSEQTQHPEQSIQ